jgi:hypothetical protein
VDYSAPHCTVYYQNGDGSIHCLMHFIVCYRSKDKLLLFAEENTGATEADNTEAAGTKRQRGRKLGSKNKKKKDIVLNEADGPIDEATLAKLDNTKTDNSLEKYYEYLPNQRAKCYICTKQFSRKTISRVAHLERKHKPCFIKYKLAIDKKQQEKKEKEEKKLEAKKRQEAARLASIVPMQFPTEFSGNFCRFKSYGKYIGIGYLNNYYFNFKINMHLTLILYKFYAI